MRQDLGQSLNRSRRSWNQNQNQSLLCYQPHRWQHGLVRRSTSMSIVRNANTKLKVKQIRRSSFDLLSDHIHLFRILQLISDLFNVPINCIDRYLQRLCCCLNFTHAILTRPCLRSIKIWVIPIDTWCIYGMHAPPSIQSWQGGGI